MKEETFFRSYETERRLRQKTTRYLNSLFPQVWYVVSTGVSLKGCPDILACVMGEFVAIELKTKKGKLSGPQEEEIARITQAGGVATECRNIQEVMKTIEKITKRKGD